MLDLSRTTHALRTALAVAVFGLVSACAATPDPPVAEMEGARQAIANAEQLRASADAPLELSRAREKLQAANEAIDDNDMRQAKRLAHESRVLAELALAKAEMEDARRVNREIVQTTEILREELDRNRRSGGL